MADPVYITVEEDVVEIIEVGQQGPAGPPGTGSGGGLVVAANLAAFPAVGVDGNTYLAQDTGNLYYWNVSQYTQIIPTEYNGIKYAVNPTLPATPGEGSTFWNSADHCLDTYTGLGGVVIQNGQELLLIGYVPANATTIEDGWPVSLDGSSGQRPIVYRTDVTSETACRCFIGTATMQITPGNHGFICMKGLVRGIDTRGPGNAWAEGDRLWATNTAPWYLTNTEPTTGQRVLVGMIIIKSAQGMVFSNPRHFELTAEIKGAIDNSYQPSAANPFATEASIEQNPLVQWSKKNRGWLFGVSSDVSIVHGGISGCQITSLDISTAVYDGTEINLSIGQQLNSDVAPDAGGRLFGFIDGDTRDFAFSLTPFNILVDIPWFVAYWNGTTFRVAPEWHNHTRNIDWHYNRHITFGAQIDQTYNNGVNGACTFTSSSMSLGPARILDEDFPLVQAGTTTSAYLWTQISAGLWAFGAAPVNVAANIVAGALKYDADGILTSVPSGYYCRNDVYFTHLDGGSYEIVTGQGAYSTEVEAKFAPAAKPSFALESKRFFRTIWKNNGGTPELVSVVDWRHTDDWTIPTTAVATVTKLVQSAPTIGYGTQSLNTYTATQADDATYWQITEAAGAPPVGGSPLRVTGGTGAGAFLVTGPIIQIVVGASYSGAGVGGHNVSFQLWNFKTATWDTKATLTNTMTNYIMAVDDSTYRSGGEVRWRFEHSAVTGNGTHILAVNYLAAVQSDYRTVADHEALTVPHTNAAITGQYDVLASYQAGASPATVTHNYRDGNAIYVDRVTNNPASLSLAFTNWPTGAGKSAMIAVYLDCGTQTSLTLPAGFNAITLTASKLNMLVLESFYNTRTAATVYRATLREAF